MGARCKRGGLLAVSAAPAPAAFRTRFAGRDVPALLGHQMVCRVEGQRNNGILCILEEWTHYAGREAAHLKGRVEHRAHGIECRSRGNCRRITVRRQYIGIEELLGSDISGTSVVSACFADHGVSIQDAQK
jgi:hypothetical protein